jgi:hypothetical protein
MKTTDRPSMQRRLHGTVGQTTKVTLHGPFGRLELQLVNGRYRLTAINKQTKQHFTKYYATLPGAMVAFDTLKENWV